MAFDDTPNKLESAFIQRSEANSVYEQVNISGSDLIFYHSSSGELTADKISVWASQYLVGKVGPVIQSGSVLLSGITSSIINFSHKMPNATYVIGMSTNAIVTGLIWSGKTNIGFTASMNSFTGILDWSVIGSN